MLQGSPKGLWISTKLHEVVTEKRIFLRLLRQDLQSRYIYTDCILYIRHYEGTNSGLECGCETKRDESIR